MFWLSATKWIGTGTGVSSAIVIALDLGILVYGFALFLLSSFIAACGGRILWDQPQCGGDLGAALRINRKRCRKAKWRKHFAAGKARGIPARAHRQAAGLDAGRDRCGDEQARHPGQPQRGLAVLRPTQHQLQKKLCTRQSKSARTWPAPAGAGCASKACLIRRGWCSLTKPARTQRWFGCAAALGVASGSLTTRRMDIGRQSPSWPAYAIAG